MDIQSVQHGRDGGYFVNGSLAVPDDPANRHYRAIQAWIDSGNPVAPADPAPGFTPSDVVIRLAALEAKTGITDADRAAAKAELIIREGQ